MINNQHEKQTAKVKNKEILLKLAVIFHFFLIFLNL